MDLSEENSFFFFPLLQGDLRGFPVPKGALQESWEGTPFQGV